MDLYDARPRDLDLLAEWNHQLITDEGHSNPMTVAELRERMRQWLEIGYRAVIFTTDSRPVAYAVFKESDDEIYLRQFFVRRDRRREGIGRAAFSLLRDKLWPADKRLTVDVLATNHPAAQFWHSLGFNDYCITMEILHPNSR